MRGSLLASLLFVGLSFAGCLQASEEAIPPAGTGDRVTVDEGRPDPVFEDVVTGPSAAPDLTATLDAVPELRVGEWWRIRLHDPFRGEDTEFIRVLAAIDGDHYVFGMPHEGWWKEAVVFHTPAFGEVNKADLSYNTHDILFTPLKFPLKDGDTWETEFSGGPPMTANVKVEGPTTARITFTTQGGGPLPLPAIAGGGGQNVVLELLYDAAMHEVVEFNHGTVSFTVVDHGYDFEGWVTVPRGERLVFLHGRFAGAMGIDQQPSPPTEQVEIAGGFNRMSFITFVTAWGPGVAATCRESATAPDGATFVSEMTPCVGMRIDFHEAKDPDGVWDLEHLAGGTSTAFIEGIAYHQYDIQLPGGAIRSDHSHEVIR